MAVAAAAVIAVAVRGYRAVSSSSSSNPSGLTGNPASAAAGASVIEDIVLPAYVVLDSVFAEKEQAQRQLVDLGHAGYSNTGFFYIPEFRYLSGAKLYQVYIGPFEQKADAEAAVCAYNRQNDTVTYGLRLSTEPGREEIRCPG
jgi:hypothetical protein